MSPFHLARAVPPGMKKTVFDAWNGYHSVRLHEDDRHYTTFITPWGRYRYCTAPQGYIASGDGYTSRYDSIVTGVSNKTKCIDDTLLWTEDVAKSYQQAVIPAGSGLARPVRPQWSHTQPGQIPDQVEFAGFEITMTNVKPWIKYTRAR